MGLFPIRKTFVSNVHKILDQHEIDENKQDNETGIERFGQSDPLLDATIERVRQKKDVMLGARKDCLLAKEHSSNAKRKRELDLFDQGKVLRDNLARGIIGGEEIQLGSRPALHADGSIGEAVANSSGGAGSANLLSPHGSDGGFKRRRRNNRQQDAISEILSSNTNPRYKIEKQRLDFESEKFSKVNY